MLRTVAKRNTPGRAQLECLSISELDHQHKIKICYDTMLKSVHDLYLWVHDDWKG